MRHAKSILYAFAFGGMFGSVATLLRGCVAPLVPSMLVDPVTLVFMGLLGAVMYATGVHQRIEKTAGAGSFVPLNGFSAAVAGAFENARNQGKTIPVAFLQGFLLLVKVILSGTVVVMVLAFFLVGLMGW